MTLWEDHLALSLKCKVVGKIPKLNQDLPSWTKQMRNGLDTGQQTAQMPMTAITLVIVVRVPSARLKIWGF